MASTLADNSSRTLPASGRKREQEIRLFASTRRYDCKRLHLASLKRGRVPLTEESPLASAIHGLGLLIATAMALTGAVGYFFPAARFLLGIHETIAPIMWAYLIGHVGLALLHQLAGHRILQRMFGFGKSGNAQLDR